jgi:hypothetical protein
MKTAIKINNTINFQLTADSLRVMNNKRLPILRVEGLRNAA